MSEPWITLPNGRSLTEDQLRTLRTLHELVERWEQSARAQFATADRYPDGSMEQRALAHGGMCYFNCAAALRQVAGFPQLPDPNRPMLSDSRNG